MEGGKDTEVLEFQDQPSAFSKRSQFFTGLPQKTCHFLERIIGEARQAAECSPFCRSSLALAGKVCKGSICDDGLSNSASTSFTHD